MDVQYMDIQCIEYQVQQYPSQTRNRSITPLAQLTQPFSRKYDQNNL